MSKVLMISTDAKILEEGSAVRARMQEYGKLFDELHIIVFSKQDSKSKVQNSKISDNTFIYPTSCSRLSSVMRAIRIGEGIVSGSGWIITTQDPFETGIVGRSLSKRFGIPLNVQIHTDFLNPNFTKGSALNALRQVFARMTLPQAASVRVVSKRIKDSLMRDRR
ncbi:MAG: hypothetical protein WC767_02470, partial [Candidatus Paceibacterota bacterium]